jgi:putative membrane protein
MQNPGGPYQGQYGGTYSGGLPRAPPPRRIPWLMIGLTVMLALIGVAVLIILLFPATFGYHPSESGYGPFGLLGGFFLFFIFIMIILAVVRIVLWSSRAGGYGYRQGYGGGRRYGAVAIARARYARGEISREQFDQIMQDLQRRPGYPPPP